MRQFLRIFGRGSAGPAAQTPEEAESNSPVLSRPGESPAAEEHVILYNSTTNTLLHTIDPNSLSNPSEVCSICQVELQDTQDEEKVIVETVCGHHFCSTCINGYLTHQTIQPTQPGRIRCPNCGEEWRIIWDPEGETPPQRRGGAERAEDDDELEEVWNAAPPPSPERGLDAVLPAMRREESVRRQVTGAELADAIHALQAGFGSRGFF